MLKVWAVSKIPYQSKISKIYINNIEFIQNIECIKYNININIIPVNY